MKHIYFFFLFIPFLSNAAAFITPVCDTFMLTSGFQIIGTLIESDEDHLKIEYCDEEKVVLIKKKKIKEIRYAKRVEQNKDSLNSRDIGIILTLIAVASTLLMVPFFVIALTSFPSIGSVILVLLGITALLLFLRSQKKKFKAKLKKDNQK